MRELASDAAHSSVSRQHAQRVARRYLTGLSAAGVTAALALTGAVGDASASPAANASAHVVTLTSNSTAPTGHVTVQVRYQLEPRGRKKLLSVTYSGASKISLKHPALIVSLRPVLPTPRRTQVRAFAVILRLHSSKHFSGALSAKLLALIGKSLASPPRRLHPGGFVLAATVASVIRSKGPGPVGIAAPVGLQVGVLLGPVMP